MAGGVVEIAHIGICCQLRFIITWQLSEPRSARNSHVVISLLLPARLADTEDNRDDVRALHNVTGGTGGLSVHSREVISLSRPCKYLLMQKIS